MRVIPDRIPNFDDLKLPPQLQEICGLRNGIVLVTGPTGSGKSSTLAAIHRQNERGKSLPHSSPLKTPSNFSIATKKATIHQRELHSDTPTFSAALRGALRQAPKVILVGEMRDRETIEIALESLRNRPPGSFDAPHHRRRQNRRAHHRRFPNGRSAGHAQSPRQVVPLHHFSASASAGDGNGRLAVIEILKSTLRTREYVEKGEGEGKTLLDAMRDGNTEGMQYFDGEIEKLIRSGAIDFETGSTYATNPATSASKLADFLDGQEKPKSAKRETELELTS